jgi:hypothetical protein
MLSLQIADHVRHQSQDHGGVIILDTAAGLWIALNPTAGDFWRSWDSGVGFEKGVAQVAARYPDVSPESIRADAEHLVQDLFYRGLITAIPHIVPSGAAAAMAEPEAAVTGPGPGWLRVAAAMLFLVAANVLVRCSFRTSLALVRASRRNWCRRAPTPQQAAIAVTAVSRAARCYPGRAACLEQSLAAVLLSAAHRRRLDWCLGSAPGPYRFHAWVELAGQPVTVTEGLRSQSRYVRIIVA